MNRTGRTRLLTAAAGSLVALSMTACGRTAPETDALEASASPSSSVSTPITTTPPVTETTPTTTPEYIIQEGDSLSVIAERFGVTTKALADFNGISDVNAIVVGQRLTIPPVPSESDADG